MTNRRLLLGMAVLVLASSGLAGPAVGAGLGQPAPGGVHRHGRWTDPQNVDPVADPVGVSCVTTTFCVLVDDGGNAFITTDGVDWRYYSLIDPYGEVAMGGVSCATTTFCVAVDTRGYETTFNGKRWSKVQLIDPGTAYGEWVSCLTTTFCMAAGSDGMAVTFDGTSWSQPEVIDPAAVGVQGVTGFSCGSPTLCAAMDYLGNLVAFNGKDWSKPDDVGGYWERISCGASSICVASDDIGYVSVHEQGSWSARTRVDTADDWFTGLSCSSKVFCLGYDTEDRTFLFDGTSWTVAKGTAMDVNSISCLTRHFCAATSRNHAVADYQS